MGVKTAKIIKEALLIMRKYPMFKFVIDSVMSLEYFKLHYPSMLNELKELVKQKRIELIGGMVVAPDTLLPNGESLVRQVLYGTNYLQKNFEITSKIGYFLDSFGQTAQLPQILEKSGFKYLIFVRGARNRNLPAEFLWKAPDGSKILVHYMFNTYRWVPLPFNGSIFPPLFPFFPILFTLNFIPQNFRVYELLKKLFPPIKFVVQKLNSVKIGISTNIGDISAGLKFTVEKRLKKAMTNNVLILNGDDNLPPSTNVLDVVEYLQKKSRNYNIKIALPSEFFSEVIKSKKKFGVVDNYEFTGFPDKFVGTFSSRIKLKQKIRYLENLFYLTELFSTLAGVYNENFIYPKEKITKAIWRVLCCDFHDGIPGCHVDAVYITIMKMLKLSEIQLKKLYKNAFFYLKKVINTSDLTEDSIPILIFNPISSSRTDFAQIKIPKEFQPFTIHDENGNLINYQKDSISTEKNQFMIKASKIPSLGYKIYQIKKTEKSVNSENTEEPLISYNYQDGLVEIENNRFRLIFENNKLKIISDKTNNSTVYSSKYYINDLRILVDRGDSYLHGKLPKKVYTTYDNKLKIVEKGPVRTVIKLKSKLKCKNKWFFKPANEITQYVILYNFKSSRIDFITSFKNNIKNIKIQACFPINFKNPKFYSEIPYGFIERDIKPKFGKSWKDLKKNFSNYDRIFPVINWMDISDINEKALCLINCGLPEYEIGVNKDYVFLTLLRSTGHLANVFPGAVPMILGLFYGIPKALELTAHEFKYSLFFHNGDIKTKTFPAEAMKHNIPLIVEKLKKQKGAMPQSLSFIKVEPENFLIKSIKKSEQNQNEIIIRIIETSNNKSTGNITFFYPIKKANLVNLLEQPIKKLDVKNGKSFSFTSNPQEILSFSVSP